MKRMPIASALLIAFASVSASAATIQVGATIVASCTVTGTSLSFGGSIDPLASTGAMDASAPLNVVCSNTTPFTVALSAGLNAGGPSNFTARTMKSGGNSLPYQLYLDSARSNIWGNGSGSGIYSGTGTGSAQNLTIYARVPTLAGAVPGAYTDTVTVTISY